eukprot:2569235-Rhodomonas_salina.3
MIHAMPCNALARALSHDVHFERREEGEGSEEKGEGKQAGAKKGREGGEDGGWKGKREGGLTPVQSCAP